MENRSTQLLKGTLEMCLLALLRERPCYGYEIVQHLARYGLDLVSEGSIYPLLSRMLTRGYIEGYLVSSTEGPSRKYYRLRPEYEAISRVHQDHLYLWILLREHGISKCLSTIRRDFRNANEGPGRSEKCHEAHASAFEGNGS